MSNKKEHANMMHVASQDAGYEIVARMLAMIRARKLASQEAD